MATVEGGATGWKLDQCHCVDGEDDVGVDAVNLDFVNKNLFLC